MSIATEAQDREDPTPGSNASVVEFGQALPAWGDPPSYEPYEELTGEQTEPVGLDESRDLRILSL
jgi:hypothetical protein